MAKVHVADPRRRFRSQLCNCRGQILPDPILVRIWLKSPPRWKVRLFMFGQICQSRRVLSLVHKGSVRDETILFSLRWNCDDYPNYGKSGERPRHLAWRQLGQWLDYAAERAGCEQNGGEN